MQSLNMRKLHEWKYSEKLPAYGRQKGGKRISWVFRIARFIGVTIDTIYNKTGNKKLCIFYRNLLEIFPAFQACYRDWWRWRASGKKVK